MDSLRLTLRLPGGVTTGEPVCMTLHLRNVGSDAVQLLLPGRPLAFDLVVRDTSNVVVWRRLAGQALAMALQVIRLAPDQEVQLAHVWDQRGTDGEVVSPGTYTVQGVLPAEDRKLTTPTVSLSIAEG